MLRAAALPAVVSRGSLVLTGLLVLSHCSSPGPRPAIRLVDEFAPELVADAPLEIRQAPSLDAWDFTASPPAEAGSGPGPTLGWRAADGVAGLTVREGKLSARSTSDWPLLMVQRAQGLDDADLIHSLEIRMRTSAGANLSVALLGDQPPPGNGQLVAMVRSFPWWETTPVVSGESFQTYQVRFGMGQSASDTRFVFLRPVDVADAVIEIESIRLISRRQHLARIASGVGWHGFQEIYRETLVSHAPERIRFDLDLPERPWLDLHVATVDHAPVTFRVTARPAGSSSPGRLLLNRVVTTPHRWEPASVNLADLAGSRVEISLALSAEEPGSLGFWGTPVIRNNTAPPVLVQGAPRLESAQSGPPRGVVFILADTLRKDHLNTYGYQRKTAPLISELAAQGARFDHALAQATWTKVSAPAILTSLYPTSHRVANFTDRLSAAATTLAEVYQGAGYATVAYSSVPFTGKFTNLHQGFEELHESSSLSRKDSSKTAREFVDRLGDWLSRHRETPFFVFLHVFDPHDPYEPDRPWNNLWADPKRRDEQKKLEDKLREIISDPILRLFAMPSREELMQAGVDPEPFLRQNRDWYDGSIRGLDVEVARLMGHLQDLELLDDTLVVFTSDHGEEFLEHGRTFHGQSTYGELSQIPLILYHPNAIPPGLVIPEVVQSIDLMPTLLELSRLPVPQEAMGQSLLPLLEAARRTKAGDGSGFDRLAAGLGWQPRPAVTEKATTTGHATPPPRDTESFALVWQGWKLIHHTLRPAGGPQYQLFKFPEDGFDQEDLAGEHDEIVSQLASLLDQWKQRAEANRLPETLPTDGLSKEELDRLRSLGYIQ